MSRRGDIVAAMKVRFSALTPDGSISPLFATVDRWRDSGSEPFTSDEVPALNIRDGNAAITHEVSLDEHALEIHLGFQVIPSATAAEVENLMDIVATSIMSDQYWSSLADGTNIDSHEIDKSTAMSDTQAAGGMKVIVNYTTPKGQI